VTTGTSGRRARFEAEQQLVNPWHRAAQVIASLDYAKQDDVRERVWSERWGLVIIDEAHKCSAYTKSSSGQGGRVRVALGDLGGLLGDVAFRDIGDPEDGASGVADGQLVTCRNTVSRGPARAFAAPARSHRPERKHTRHASSAIESPPPPSSPLTRRAGPWDVGPRNRRLPARSGAAGLGCSVPRGVERARAGPVADPDAATGAPRVVPNLLAVGAALDARGATEDSEDDCLRLALDEPKREG
jgi:hypothetical protein